MNTCLLLRPLKKLATNTIKDKSLKFQKKSNIGKQASTASISNLGTKGQQIVNNSGILLVINTALVTTVSVLLTSNNRNHFWLASK